MQLPVDKKKRLLEEVVTQDGAYELEQGTVLSLSNGHLPHFRTTEFNTRPLLNISFKRAGRCIKNAVGSLGR